MFFIQVSKRCLREDRLYYKDDPRFLNTSY